MSDQRLVYSMKVLEWRMFVAQELEATVSLLVKKMGPLSTFPESDDTFLASLRVFLIIEG
jgi:hypothetical protein